MHKKAQVTIFIVIGIVILIVLGLVFYFSSDDAEKRLFTDTDEEVVAVQNFIEQCLDAVAVPGVYLLAAQGGFIYLPEDHLQGDFGNVAYSYSFGENKLIAKNSMAEQLNQYIMSTFPGCINNFESFEGVPITANQPKASVTIQSTYIQVNLQYQVKVKDTTLDIFTKEISLPLGAMHGVAFQIIQEQAQNPDWIDLTGLQEYDYDVSVIPYDRE